MKKFVKRTIQLILILIVLIVAALIIVPIIFKPQLMDLAKKEINNSINANVEFSDFQVSLLKGFPNLYIGLKGLTVVGIDGFANDTLVAFDAFSVKVDLMSVIGMKNIEVKSVLLARPRLIARINREGKSNWDIAKPSTDTVVTQQAGEEPSRLNVALRKFEICNATIKYIDESSSMSAQMDNLNFLLSGNMGMDYTNLSIKTTIDAFTFSMDGLKYMNKAKVGFSGDIGADMVNSAYAFKDNEFYINTISLFFAGSVKMPKDDIDIDVTFNTNKADFKSILSLVPAIYMKGFEGLQASGKVKLQGFAKGIYNDKVMPNANVELLVENAMFKYPALPKSADNINVHTKVNFDGTNMDNTTVDVNRFHVELANNPFDAQVHVSTPMSDMQVAGFFKGKIDFTSLADVVPLDSMTIKGLLESNIDFGGRMSYIEKQQYEKFKANGTMKLTNFEFTSPDLPQGFRIVESTMKFSPRYVDLVTFDSRIGKSDLQMAGRLENFIPYIFNNQTIKGNLNITSNILDANEFLTAEETVDTANVDTTVMAVVEIPKNVDFAVNTKVNHIYYDKLDISNLNGKLTVKDGKVNMDNLNMSMLDGSLTVSGEYNTQNIQKPTVALDMNVKGFDIPTSIKSFSMLRKIASSAKEVKGKVSTQFTMTSTLDSTMSPILNSIFAKGKLQSESIGFTNSKVFGKLAEILKKDALRNPEMKNVNLSFSIKDGKIFIDPFDTKVSDFKMRIGGDMGLDQTLNFKAKMTIPRSNLGSANDLINALTSKVNVKLSENINLNVKIGGTTTNPEVRPDWEGSDSDETKESTKGTVKEIVKETVKAKSKEEAEKLVADAQKEAVRLHDEAVAAGDKLRSEAKDKADKLEAEGNKKGGLAAVAAKSAAKELKREADKSGNKLVQEADAKGQALIEKAKLEAGKL
ncbi:MAG: AsmA family protein [Bacteroidales bacterium]|nr:MAG: AsmA family protein [Bacteroidales bacterium]